MYIPKIKLKIGGKIPGKLLDPKSGRQFLGKFVQDHTGKFFKGERVTSESEELEFVPDAAKPSEALGFKHMYVSPTSQDYSKGIFIRYFLKDARIDRVIEVDRKNYLLEVKAKKNYRKTLKLQWFIKGPVEDQKVGEYLYPGASSKNQDVINQSEKVLPGISSLLKDTKQFVV